MRFIEGIGDFGMLITLIYEAESVDNCTPVLRFPLETPFGVHIPPKEEFRHEAG
jgi:hypothetical protein